MATETGGTAPFRPRARLIRLLGDELISDEVMAVVELVKNAFDADAREVTVGLYRPGDPDAACLEVRDDGDGMELDTLLHAWFEPATDRKRRGHRKVRTALGRYPLGEKGVGRFAVDKLGAEMELVTRARRKRQELRLHIQWDRFNTDGYLDEIENHWEVHAPRVFDGQTHGTRLRVTRLRTPWDIAKVTRLRDGLARLVSPFTTMSDFRITLVCPDFPDYAGGVSNDLLKHAPYRLGGRVDATGLLHLDDQSGAAVDLRQAVSERFVRANRPRMPACGPFHVALYVWDLDSVGLRRAAMDRTTRAVLKRSCGVSIYRDGFRVWPYGAPGDDWLELNQRRVNNPTMRVSTNQIVGIVEITQEHNPELRDRTSREGLIDTPALHDLKALVLGAISRLEEQRFARRQDGVTQEPGRSEADAVLQLIHRLHDPSQTGEITARLDHLATAYRQQLQVYRAREERLMRLASTGLMAERLGMEINRTISAAGTALRVARNVAGQRAIPDQIVQCLAQIEGHFFLLGEQLDAMEPLYAGNGSEGRERLDVRSTVQHVATVFAFSLQRAGVRLTLRAPAPLTVRMRRAHLLQVLLSLFDNALYWLKFTPQDRRPEICVQLLSNPPGFVFADSGPGVRAELRDRVFQPFFTGRGNGRGLGLYLAKSLLESYGFSIELSGEPGVLPGANFRVLFGRSPGSGEKPHG
jgi:hypothetical protein